LSIKEILQQVKDGRLSIDEAASRLAKPYVVEVEEFARLDIERQMRRGVPEVILAEDKSPSELLRIVREVAGHAGIAVVTRVGGEHLKALRRLKGRGFEVEESSRGRTLLVRRRGFKPKATGGHVAILTGGTSDIPVAEEAKLVAEAMGCKVSAAYDVGVAGLHRLIPPLRKMVEEKVDAYVVVAGMEGALPSVVAGLVDAPVIGVPTSTGYGHGGRGEGALSTMLQSCTLGLATVNIDNGVGGGAFAALIANRMAEARRSKG